MYAVMQQTLRQSANDPQVQMAYDGAYKLNNGSKPQQLSGLFIDIKNSQSSFIIIYDKNGNTVSGTGQLDGKLAKIPVGVLKSAKTGHDNRVTWAPAKGVRIASVTVAANDYYVTAGRSLMDTESRIGKIGMLVEAGWVLSVVTIVACNFNQQIMRIFVKNKPTA